MTTPRPPAPLPRPARALLAAYRDAHELPKAAKARIWSVVGSEDAPAPAYDPLDHVDPSPSGSSGGVRWLGWGTAMLGAAAVLGLAWQLGGTLGERRTASRTPDAAVMQGGAGSPQGRASVGTRERAEAREAAAPATASAPAAPEISGAAAGSEALDPARAASRSGSPSSTSRPSSTGSASSSKQEPARAEPELGSTLAAERELVARAWRALALGETTPALDAAAEHARRFHAGLLAPERAAIDTIARCRRGDADGPRHATAFHRAHPGSPLAERVDEACVAAAKP